MAVNIKRVRKIEVSVETYDRLQRRAVPFEDSPDSVIARLLDQSGTEGDGPAAGERATNGTASGGDAALESGPAGWTQGFGASAEIDVDVDDPFNPPSLKHTKVLRAEVDGREVPKANWTTVRQAVVAMAIDRGGYNLRRLLEVCPINAVETRKNNEGYTYYEDLGGVDTRPGRQSRVAGNGGAGARAESRRGRCGSNGGRSPTPPIRASGGC